VQAGNALKYWTELKRFAWKIEEKVAFARRSAWVFYSMAVVIYAGGGRGRVGTWGFVTEMLVLICTGLPKATA
jgi:hypothetical protein